MTDARREDRTRAVAFFGPRAPGWDDRFPDDDAAFATAVAELGARPGGVALDAGCGTGRAVPHLAAAVGRRGLVVAADVTPAMLTALLGAGRGVHGVPVIADACELPLAAGSVDAVLAGGLLPHLGDPAAGLRELARVARPGARLGLFHPVGRAVLAARHGRTLTGDEALAPARIRRLLEAAGWSPVSVDDGPDRYLALAERREA